MEFVSIYQQRKILERLMMMTTLVSSQRHQRLCGESSQQQQNEHRHVSWSGVCYSSRSIQKYLTHSHQPGLAYVCSVQYIPSVVCRRLPGIRAFIDVILTSVPQIGRGTRYIQGSNYPTLDIFKVTISFHLSNFRYLSSWSQGLHRLLQDSDPEMVFHYLEKWLFF